MIEFVSGDFFDYPADIRVNTVNCVGVMGAGVALAFKRKYPQMFEEYAKACALKKIRPGVPIVWKEGDIFKLNGITIINFPTKDHWRAPSKYEFIEEGLKWLKTYLADKSGKTITLPALGCGHGGLDWNIVRPIIVKYLQDSPARVLVFEPASSLSQVVPDEDLQRLEQQRVKKMSSADIFFPETLKGKSAKNIYVKGDRSRMKDKMVSIIIDSKAEEREKAAVKMCINMLANSGVTLLMGFSSSFEIDIVKDLLIKRAPLVIVLPYGILELKVRKDLQPYWNEDEIAIISLSEPRQAWKPSESIKALIFRLQFAEAILIANYNSRALEKFEKEFKLANANIFYINYGSGKADFFNRISAKQVGRSKDTTQPNLNGIFNVLS